ncbi:MAG: Ig-like domain-containing protein [Bacillota bacterium]
MKKIISIFTIITIVFSMTIILPSVYNDSNLQKVVAAPLPLTNTLYDYFNSLSTLERRSFLETSISQFNQYGGTNAYDTYADLLVNNLDVSGALTKMGVTKPQLQNTFSVLATAPGQNFFRAAFETAVTTQLDDATMASALVSLKTNSVITAGMETFVNQFLVKFYGSLSTMDSHFYLDTSGVITVENSDVIISQVRLLFENQVDMTLLNVPALLSSYITVINAQAPTLKAAIIADLKGMKLMVNTHVSPKPDMYAKYNSLSVVQKQEVTDSLKYALLQPAVLTGAISYYNDIAARSAGEENLPNGFGLSPANYLLFIQKIQNPANITAVNALFSPFTTLTEAAVITRLDQAVTDGIMSSQLNTVMKRFIPWLNSYSKLEMPILNDMTGLQTQTNSTLITLDQFFAMLMLSDYPEAGLNFQEINDETMAWVVSFYNDLTSSTDKKTLRDYLIYFDIMNGDNLPPVPTFYPKNGSTNVPINTAITITFNEPVKLADGYTDFTQCFKITTGSTNVSFTVTQSADKKTFTFTPSRIYCDATYKVAIIDNTLVDYSNNKASGSATWSTLKQLIKLDIVNPVKNNTVYFYPGGTNTISFDGLANDKATYTLQYKVGNTWKTVSVRVTTIAGKFTWDWNGAVAGKYLPASTNPYSFQIIKNYNGKTSTVKSFKVVIQSKQSLVVVAPKVYDPSNKKSLGIKVSFNKYTNVKVAVYDRHWKLVRVLYNKKFQKPNPNLKIYWNGKDAKGKYVKAGYYYIKTTTGNKVVIKKVLITDFTIGK